MVGGEFGVLLPAFADLRVDNFIDLQFGTANHPAPFLLPRRAPRLWLSAQRLCADLEATRPSGLPIGRDAISGAHG